MKVVGQGIQKLEPEQDRQTDRQTQTHTHTYADATKLISRVVGLLKLHRFQSIYMVLTSEALSQICVRLSDVLKDVTQNYPKTNRRPVNYRASDAIYAGRQAT